MNKSDSIKELAGALAKAQAKFEQIRRDKTVTVRTKTGGSYTFSYAPLESIVGAIKKPLSDNGISLLQDVRDGKVVTILMHSSGEYYESGGTEIRVTEQGPQAYGSALTYARRYDVSLTLGLCPDDDDDGNAAEGNQASPAALPAPITPTTDCWSGIPKDRHEYLNRIGAGVLEALQDGRLEDAYQELYVEILDAEKVNNDEFVCIWDLLKSYSKGRAALKKMRAERRQLAEQA